MAVFGGAILLYSMRFQVPQNLDVPDTIFLGLNFKQLLYLGGALGFIVFVYLFLGGLSTAVALGFPVVILACFLSFFSYNNQPFSAILQSLIRFFTRKKMYMWRKTEEEGQVDSARDTQKTRSSNTDVTVPTQQKTNTPEKIREVSTNLVFADDGSDDVGSDLDVVI